MAMRRSGLLLRLNANSSNGVARQPEMARADGAACLLVRKILAGNMQCRKMTVGSASASGLSGI
jgi:hypothetical protein